MRKSMERQMFWVVILISILALNCSITWADFYVIPSGKKAKKTILVRPESTQSASGTTLRNAIAGITDAGETNPYLVIIEPGVYGVGTTGLQMKEYVDIQGSGENVTKITGTVDSMTLGVLQGANNMEIRFLTVENTGGGTDSTGISNQNASPKITNVTVTATGGSDHNYGIHNQNASPVMKNVTTTGSGGSGAIGVRNATATSAPIMTNVIAASSGGSSYNYGFYNSSFCYTTIRNSVLKGTTAAFWTGSSETSYIINTKLNGGTSGTAIKCVGVYDGDFDFYAGETCP